LFFLCFTVNNPIPSNLKSEAKKAAKILREFTEITSRNGPDKIIPPWSAPSAIGIAGLGGGFEIGIEAMKYFISFLSRNLEGDVALRSSAAVYTYCKSRGLFAGVSLEGTCLIERKETNRKFYGQDIRASAILLGDVPFPAQAEDLYETLASFTEVYENEERRNNPGKAVREQGRFFVTNFFSLCKLFAVKDTGNVNDPPGRPSRPEPHKPSVRPTPPG
ncbi:UNVERIFIED_CONTAM: hypothetical protein H355_000786, partial [Colinus virginianus]